MGDVSCIDVVGRSCRLPGANSVEAFRQVLFEGKCTVTETPSERWAHWRYLHPVPGTVGKSYTFAAGVLDDIWGFDPKVFNISPREASQLDPQQRILLQLTWEAIEDAGIPPSDLAGKPVGVYVGASALDYGNRLLFDATVTDAYTMTGNTLSLISNRISHAFDLSGPSMTVDTACSSSLVALNEAVAALQAGTVDCAIVAGVNILGNPASFVGFSAARMLSPNGLCQSFSASADGYVRAEGGVVLVLQRADANIVRSSKSYGSIVACATNNDGRTLGVALPDSLKQSELLEQVYSQADIDPDSLSFVEAHGTGTLVGDPIEARALGKALGQHRSKPLLIGSVKSNIGHLEPASGLAGVLKSLIALEDNKLPPSLHADELNPDIDFGALNLNLAREVVDLPTEGDARYAGVSSFGFGGANAHVIIAAPQTSASVEQDVPVGAASGSTPLFFASAFCKDSLRQLSWRYGSCFSEDDQASNALLSNQAVYKRGVFPHRIAITGASGGDVRPHLKAFMAEKRDPRVLTAVSTLQDAPPVFVYSGNGAQFVGMSRAALDSDPVYAEHYDDIDGRFQEIAGWSLKEKLTDPNLAEELPQADVAQALLFADQAALTHALIERGLEPPMVFGHSGGEVAAAYASGALDLDQALVIIHQRSISQASLAGRGAMAALQLPEAESLQAASEFEGGHIEVAAVNSPASTTLTGPKEDIEKFIRWARRERRWPCLKLSVNYPYHSQMQDEVEAPLREALAGIRPHATKIPFVSSVTGKVTRGEDLNVDYWWSNVRQPVRFFDAATTAHELGHRFFLECSPQPVLASYLNDSLAGHGEGHVVTHCFEKSDTSDVNPVERAFCRAFVHGARIDKTRVFGEPIQSVLPLPSYPWQNTEFRSDKTAPILEQFSTNEDLHPLLGRGLGVSNDLWLRHMDVHLMADFADHVVGGRSILPGSAFIEMASAAAQRSIGSPSIELRDLDIVAPLTLADKQMLEVKTAVSNDSRSVRISSRTWSGDENWRVHASCRIGELASDAHSKMRAPNRKKLKADQDGNRLYELARQLGLNYGPAFQQVSHFRQSAENAVEVVLKPFEKAPHDFATALDPIRTDGIFHGLLAVLLAHSDAAETRGYVPVHASRVRLLQSGGNLESGRIEIVRVGSRSLAANFYCFDDQGELIACLEGVRFRAVSLTNQIQLNAHTYGYHLQPIAALRMPAERQAIASLDEISALFQRSAERAELEPDDVSFLIVEAIAQRIAYDTICQLTDERGYYVSNDQDEEGENGVNATRQSYVNGLLRIIERANLAQQDAEGWLVDSESTLPTADELISGLLADKPERVQECAVLAQLKATLPDLIQGDLDWSLDEIFGRNALEGLSFGSALSRRRNQLLHDALRSLEDLVPRDGCLRIAEVVNAVDGGAVQHTQFSNPEAIELFRLCADKDQLIALSPQSPERVGPQIVDVSLDPVDIAKHGPFDLVIVGSGVHRVPEIDELLPVLRNRMAPEGLLIALADAPDNFHDLVFGIGSGWYDQSASSDFPVGALRIEAEWDASFQAAGFEKIQQSQLPDGLSGLNLILASAPAATPVAKADVQIANGKSHSDEPPQDAIDVSAYKDTPFEQLLVRYFAENDHAADDAPLACDFDDDAQAWIYRKDRLAEKRAPFIACHFLGNTDRQAAQEGLEKRIAFLSGLLIETADAPTELWAILPGGASYFGASAVHPAHVALWSFLRTAANEFPNVQVRCIDADTQNQPEQSASAFFQLALSGGAETELVIKDDWYGALRVRQGLKGLVDDVSEDFDETLYRTCLPLTAAEKLDDLEWRLSERRAPGPEEVEVGVEATGLNYRDVMWALGVLPEEALENGFAGATYGIECAGKIVRVGKDVEDLKVGDRVVAIGPASFSSHVTVGRSSVGVLPDDVEFAAAATLPVAYFTAYYAMSHLAGLKAGETVLIHGAAGGVGLAAIQIAKMCGATVIATAGTNVKRSLLRSLDVEHVLDSRSLAFVDDVLSITDGQGVDVVLNSLAGEAMELGLTVLRPFGRFLELGKQDFYANTKIGLRALKENISYFGIDADQLLAGRPDVAKQILDKVVALAASGEITPLPYRRFEAERLADAFKLMQRSGHIGKIVVTPQAPQRMLALESSPRFEADANGAHLIIGGLGGLGIEMMNWAAHHGARNIVLVGRSANVSKSAQAKIDALKARGLDIRIAACDVSDRTALDDLLAELRANMPIKGVIHAAMVLNDVQIKSLDPENLRQTLNAKVTGSENLDQATRADELDYFVLFSSIATLIGNHGQGAYVAANGYLEGLARQRRAANLPALAIGWGAITDAGYLTQHSDKAEVVRTMSGNVEFTAQQAMHCLSRLLASPGHQPLDGVVSVTPMTWSAALGALRLLKGPTYGLLANLGARASQASGSEDLRASLLELPAEKREEQLIAFISKTISGILRIPLKDINTNRPISELGMDSLMGVEFGLAAQQALGDDIPLMSVSDALSIKDIAAKINVHLSNETTSDADRNSTLENLAALHEDVLGAAAKSTEFISDVEEREAKIMKVLG